MAIHPQQVAFIFGLLGNAISFMVYLAPLPTFYLVYKKKSTEAFQSIPYVVALFSSMLWIYYALVKKDDSLLLITINSFGCVIESIYLAIFLFYAPNKARLSTIKLLLVLNVFGFGAMLLSTLYLTEGTKRLHVIGWICLVFNICVFAAPLGILRRVIKTKSVEYVPLSLSFFLTLNAVMRFFNGLFLKGYYIALPNIVGLTFGMIQMVLYAMYRKSTPVQDQKLPEHKGDIENGVVNVVTDEKLEVSTQPCDIEIAEKKQDQAADQTGNEKTEENKNEEKRGEGFPQEQGVSCQVRLTLDCTARLVPLRLSLSLSLSPVRVRFVKQV
ncbi:hypothetical protein L6164_014895 [Bauhinia variegata]|uniref:Uncharacterized protein n=1 Tax=Bauhinia variegata TaxID=167791 RepID=A0ACB9NJP7_BAUVA|nr:hypothetical protein L6164_014895 [Bauhinia variegata]